MSNEQQRSRRALFSCEVDAYDSGRPGYPDGVYDVLREVCGLGPTTRVLEIGPGTGQATGRLLDAGASVTAVELGAELANRLAENYSGRPLVVEVGAFEELDLSTTTVDLVVAATSFHWIPTDVGLQRCADILSPGGWLALWWTVFGDPDRPDPFHDALRPVLEELAPPVLDVASAGAPGASAHALDATSRISEIDATGRFGDVRHTLIPWTGCHSATEIRSLFASFSPWLALPADQRRVALDALEALAKEQFGGRVERPYLTSVYLAQRAG